MAYHYVGEELELFAKADNWKNYVAHSIGRYIGPRVLEVGAGLGSNIPYLCDGVTREWVALEPDPDMARQIPARIGDSSGAAKCRVVNGTIDELALDDLYDTILYLDVLEHIADDRSELERATRHLTRNGKLVVLAPAHQFLFSPFDEAVGHYRRYGPAALDAITPAGFRLAGYRMLDSVGFFASLANRVMLRAPQPTPGQIEFWDGILVPLSRIVDRLTGFSFGKSIVAVWCRESA